jgi:hypothetical protein
MAHRLVDLRIPTTPRGSIPEQESGRAGTLCNRNREHCRDAKS